MLKINTKAPHFTLPNENKELVSLDNYLGKKVILYFYPKDMTTGCTKEACDFRDNYQLFKENNYHIIGISKDTASSHTKFKNMYKLPFTLLADKDKEVCKLYDVLKEKSMYGKKYLGISRSTYIINEEGIITHVFEDVDYKNHIKDLLKEIGV